MYHLLIVIHLIVCFFLIFIILIQSSKGAELGAAFGGSNQTLFGSRGAATFLNKLTTVAAIVFMLTSLSLAILSMNRGSIISEDVPVSKQLPTKPYTQTTGPLHEEPEGQSSPLKPAE
jgi:preprotein translocase subunit SecG